MEIGSKKFQFQTDLFDLETQIIGTLNEQISDIPANFAYVSQALAEAERVQAQAELAMDLFMAEKLSLYSEEKTEGAKRAKVLTHWTKEHTEKSTALQEANHMVRVIKGYRDGMESKYQLAQTLSANLRTERESFGKMG